MFCIIVNDKLGIIFRHTAYVRAGDVTRCRWRKPPVADMVLVLFGTSIWGDMTDNFKCPALVASIFLLCGNKRLGKLPIKRILLFFHKHTCICTKPDGIYTRSEAGDIYWKRFVINWMTTGHTNAKHIKDAAMLISIVNISCRKAN